MRPLVFFAHSNGQTTPFYNPQTKSCLRKAWQACTTWSQVEASTNFQCKPRETGPRLRANRPTESMFVELARARLLPGSEERIREHIILGLYNSLMFLIIIGIVFTLSLLRTNKFRVKTAKLQSWTFEPRCLREHPCKIAGMQLAKTRKSPRNDVQILGPFVASR